MIKEANDLGVGKYWPDLTLLLDLPIEIGFKRLKETGKSLDKIEQESLRFHNKVRDGYWEIARENPQKVHLIEAKRPFEDVYIEAKGVIQRRFIIVLTK